MIFLMDMLGIFTCELHRQYQLMLDRVGNPTSQGAPLTVGRVILAGIVTFTLFGGMFFFLGHVRPYLAQRLGKRLGVTIVERRGAKGRYWSVAEPGRFGAAVIVTLVEILILLLGVGVPNALWMLLLVWLFAT
ncbi:MAG: hypothetical protein HGA19_02155 [Oscillochloris sp.]|nr:hypothetical protein [Oscillochloris sp.]